jgi:UDP-3-O-[3-hydroxymyristoyl] N-acetylglucosamine deacetylase
VDKVLIAPTRNQKTLAHSIDYTGIGLHTGETVDLKIIPAPENTGIIFNRSDIPGSASIPALIPSVCDTSDRCTVLGNAQAKIYTVEHLMAALFANQIDNAIIELSNIEPPVGNGSSDVFVELIEKAGVCEQKSPKMSLIVKEPVYFNTGDITLVALPAPQYKISYTLHYPRVAALKSQYNSFDITPEIFNRELSPCRTFCLYEEISFLMDKGLIKGGSLDNAVVVKGEAYLSKNGLFFPDEPVRHKILDIVGDLSLIGYDIQAHIIAVKAGHAANYGLAKELHNLIQTKATHGHSAFAT